MKINLIIKEEIFFFLNESDDTIQITKEEAKKLIFDTKGRMFTVLFIKKDGSERIMNARLGVKKHLKGGELRYNPNDFNMITVFDVKAGGYRMISINTLKKIKFANKVYEIMD